VQVQYGLKVEGSTGCLKGKNRIAMCAELGLKYFGLVVRQTTD